MKRSINRREALTVVFGAAALPAFAQTQIEGPYTDQTAFVLLDLADGSVLDAHRADALQIPASLAKLFTMAAAHSLIPGDHAFTTRLFGDGAGLALDGGGDPSVGLETLRKLGDDAFAAGFRRVQDFRTALGAWPRTAMIEATQPAAAPYNPGIARLAIAFNRARILWSDGRPRALISGEASEIPADGLALDWADAEHPAWSVGRDATAERWFLPASAKAEFYLPIGDPVRAAGLAFRRVALDSGVEVAAPVATHRIPEDWPIVAAVSSPPADALMRDCLRYSTNLTAEMIGLAATERLTQVAPRDLRDSAAALRDYIERRFPAVDWRGLDLFNHSGLSSYSQASALQLARLLAADPILRELLPSWPAGNASAIRAKTGTMAYVRGIAGTFETRQGARVFAMLSQDIAARRALDLIQPADPEVPEESRKWLAGVKRFERAQLARWGAGVPEN